MDVVKIVLTPLEAITAHATLVINLQQIIRAVQVNRIIYIYIYVHCNEFIVPTLDMNECTLNTSGCSQNCTNIIGSYYCSCYSGYQLAADLLSCSGNKKNHRFCVL